MPTEFNMYLHLLVLKIVQTLRQDGLLSTFRKVFIHLRRIRAVDDFDVRYATDTGGLESLWKLKIRPPNAPFRRRYQATNEEVLLDAVHFLREDPQGFSFAEFASIHSAR